MKTNFGITLHTTAEIFCVFCFLFQEDAINKNVSANSTTDNGLNSLGNCIEEKRLIQEKLTEDTGKFVFTLC
jgi:hypothetical protein